MFKLLCTNTVNSSSNRPNINIEVKINTAILNSQTPLATQNRLSIPRHLKRLGTPWDLAVYTRTIDTVTLFLSVLKKSYQINVFGLHKPQ